MATKRAASKKVVSKKPDVAKATLLPSSANKEDVSKKATSQPVPLKKPVVAKATLSPSPADRKSSIQKQMTALQLQIEALDAQTVAELKGKISDTKKILRGYELELEELTGKRSATPRKIRRG